MRNDYRHNRAPALAFDVNELRVHFAFRFLHLPFFRVAKNVRVQTHFLPVPLSQSVVFRDRTLLCEPCFPVCLVERGTPSPVSTAVGNISRLVGGWERGSRWSGFVFKTWSFSFFDDGLFV